jgi:hypothetical protein
MQLLFWTKGLVGRGLIWDLEVEHNKVAVLELRFGEAEFCFFVKECILLNSDKKNLYFKNIILLY